METTKKNCYMKSEGAVDNRTVSRGLKKISLGSQESQQSGNVR